MIARVLVPWLAFSFAVLVLGLVSQEAPFEPEHAFWSLVLSLPVAVSVLRGGAGNLADRQLRYPSASLLILCAWIITFAPSLVVESEAARYIYYYSDESVVLARVLFLAWCMVFVAAVGRAPAPQLRVRADVADYIALIIISVLLTSYLISTGLFSAYLPGNRPRVPEAGSAASTAHKLGIPLLIHLPPLLLVLRLRATLGRRWRAAVWVTFWASWVPLALQASRTTLALGMLACLLICRAHGMRLRKRTLVGLGLVVPAAMGLTLVYRSALVSTEAGASSVGQYISAASKTTSSLGSEEAQGQAVDMIQENVRVRLRFGQVFYLVVDYWLDTGASMRGTLLSGLIQTLPTVVMSEKNEIANALDFELALLETQRFPNTDLPPTPWMQWLFELGLFGLALGALGYAVLARAAETQIGRTHSFYAVMFWLQLFSSVLSPEHTTDKLALIARNALILAALTAALAHLTRWTTGSLFRARATS